MNRQTRIAGLILTAVGLAILLFSILWINSRQNEKKFALFNAAAEGDLEQVKLFVQQGAPINQQFQRTFGWTPLINAIFHGRTNVVYYLIRAGADVNLPDKSGKTPLIWATSLGDEAVPLVRDLIAHGAIVDSKDKEGLTALDRAYGSKPIPALIEALQAAQHSHATNH
jgi:ankyrin repeat protein